MSAESTLDLSLREECHRLAQELSDRFKWSLLSNQELGDRLFQAARAEGLPDTLSPTGPTLSAALERLAKGLYSEQLYLACRQEGTPQQAHAFTELMDYMYSIARRLAYHSLPDRPLRTQAAAEIAQECTTRVAARLYHSLDQVRAPTAFLGYARAAIARDTLSEVARRLRSPEDSDVVPNAADRAAEPGPDEEARRRRESQAVLVDALRSLGNPRHQAVLTKSFLLEMRDHDIAAELDLAVSSVPKLRQRALQTLRRDGPLLARLKEYFREE